MILLRLLPIIFALLFLLSRRIDVDISKHKEMTVKINFNILAVVLTDDKIKKGRLKSFSKLIKSTKSILRSADYLISRSDVKLYSFTDIQHGISTPIFYNAYRVATLRFIAAYLERNARKFQFAEIQNTDSEVQNRSGFNLLLHFSLWHLIISALIFLYYIVKNRVKRVFQNV